ncbi:MAG TPA: hypothetical protein VNT75_06110 [Symbiobacteriaceae bacterium]|nr:hypothetical protein [Symbiobacteriaceae bacterium]
MKKLAVTTLVMVLSLLVLTSVAFAERGDIGGIGVRTENVKKAK